VGNSVRPPFTDEREGMASGTDESTVGRRTRALTHLVGNARAYRLQLEKQIEELRVDEYHYPLLFDVLAIAGRIVAVIDELATRELRKDP
jgi:hypothetical protein